VLLLGYVLVGRRYRLEFSANQAAYAERIAGACRAVWNAGLEQRRVAAQLNRYRDGPRRQWPSLLTQSRELTDAKSVYDWLGEVPRECLQQGPGTRVPRAARTLARAISIKAALELVPSVRERTHFW
jgi:hypothetical protein